MKRIIASAFLSISLTSFGFGIIENGSCPEALVPNPSLTVNPGILNVGMQLGFDPSNGFSFVDPNTGIPDGFDIRIACLFAQCLGTRLVIKNMALTDLEGALISGGIDIILSEQTRSAAQLARFEQVPYGGTPSFAIVGLRSTISDIKSEDLNTIINSLSGSTTNVRIAVVAGSDADLALTAFLAQNKISGITVVRVSDVAAALAEVKSGDALLFLGEGIEVEPNDPTFAQISITVPSGFTPGPVSAGIARGNCNLINAFANFVRINQSQIADLAAQFTPNFPFNPASLAFTPQAPCTLTVQDPCVAACPFIDAIKAKLCPITGPCPITVLNLPA